MKNQRAYIRSIMNEQLDARAEELAKLHNDFLVAKIPRFHRLLMERFPAIRPIFNYSLATNENDPTKLTLLRGKRILARNFDFEKEMAEHGAVIHSG